MAAAEATFDQAARLRALPVAGFRTRRIVIYQALKVNIHPCGLRPDYGRSL
jgi:hypothetical protein